MATGQEYHSILPGEVGLLLRDFTRNECLSSGCNGGLEIRLRTACAPSNTPDRCRNVADHHTCAPQDRFDMVLQLMAILEHRVIRTLAQPSQILLAKSAICPQAKSKSQLRIIAKLFVRIERQVIGEKVDIVGQQQGQPSLHPAGDTTILTAPKKTVMNKYRVCLSCNRGFDQKLRRRNARQHQGNLGTALDLQPVRRNVPKPLRLKQIIEMFKQSLALHHGRHANWVDMPVRIVVEFPACTAQAGWTASWACPAALDTTTNAAGILATGVLQFGSWAVL
jgi:hypothetical protein